MPWILADARCWDGWVWVGGIDVGARLMPSRESRSATCSPYTTDWYVLAGRCLKGEENGIVLRGTGGVPEFQVYLPVKSQSVRPGPITSGPAAMWAYTEGEF